MSAVLKRRGRWAVLDVLSSQPQIDFMVRGFWSELLLRDDDSEPIYGSPAEAFRLGEKYGERCRKVVGSAANARALLRETIALKNKAKAMHRAVIRSIKAQKLPKDDEESALSAAKLEPCATCPFIAICAATRMTCGNYRAYVADDGGSPIIVPDKTWEESFPSKEDAW